MAICPECSSKLNPTTEEERCFGGTSWYCPNCDSYWNSGDVYPGSEDDPYFEGDSEYDPDPDSPTQMSSSRLHNESDEDYDQRQEDLGNYFEGNL